MKTRAGEISKFPFFNGLPAQQIDELAKICLEQSYERGREIFSEGEAAEGFHLVTAGKIKVYKLSLDGKEQILHIFGPGEMAGEVPVFAGGNYPANAQAIEAARTLFFPRTSFMALVHREPAIAVSLLAVLSQRLRFFTHMIEDLSLKEVPGRLAAHLIYLGARSRTGETLELDITKTQLASLLGTIPETLSRILARMAQQEIISVEGRKIRVLDREALEALAAGGKGLV
ncbi:MAG: Crp/Fnr family transcriptional regulator [Syntrophobacteraceae bacterium]|nr:Crp/Fnr family transcriptional regulator [Syntrophobacteraceae bacterium]